jgi:hypothetical protein
MNDIARKYNLIDKIIHLQNNYVLNEIETLLRVVEKQTMVDDALKSIVKPTKKTLDIDALKREKGYKGVNRKRFNTLIKELNITEPIDQLLAQLKE